jgi:hypothetical protein
MPNKQVKEGDKLTGKDDTTDYTVNWNKEKENVKSRAPVWLPFEA